MSDPTKPMLRVLPERMLRATTFGEYPRALAAA